jgi:hypothetical protein
MVADYMAPSASSHQRMIVSFAQHGETENGLKLATNSVRHADSSEYLAECDQRRAYISHFDGSAGCAVITSDEARLWTDGRYWLQAEKQLDECVGRILVWSCCFL